MAAPKQLLMIEKVTARVFCHHGGGGGNPVTIFAAPPPHLLPSRRQRERLAQTCDWESVFVGLRRAAVPDSSGRKSFRPPPQIMAFHMPTGEQVSFCAHAALGGSTLLWSSSDNHGTGDGGRLCFAAASMHDEGEENDNIDPSSVYHSTIDSNSRNNMMVSLEMDEVPWTEEPLTSSDEAQVRSMLRKFHDVVVTPSREDDPDPTVGTKEQQPSFCNASVARHKTLVRVAAQLLHEARAPTAPDQYREACDAIDSTGLYLYAKHPTEEGAWECRQFPRASGYPEDPATGIAAAALACSLRHHHQETSHCSSYKFYQGFAMGQPSLIVVENLELRNVVRGGDCANGSRAASGRASFRLKGKVEVDGRETIEIDEDVDPQ